ncbi:hypothetical protein VFPBJ_10745 [Purpureocillium lilacinum]|uniref:Uncharacterized protein n=1 Tax=Purpureocillium lilacinum TaxID=33203 RepID=A0A179FVZ2_PURLI|nr:hypothetical protein VFPBJ_10745 [Purpureocillium lilacinum]
MMAVDVLFAPEEGGLLFLLVPGHGVLVAGRGGRAAHREALREHEQHRLFTSRCSGR